MVINHTHFGDFKDDWDDQPSPAARSSARQKPPSSPQQHSESLVARVDRLTKAVAESHAVIRGDGVAVDVKANGHVVAVLLDERYFPGGNRLGAMLAEMINRARDQAQSQVGDVASEIAADPRVTRMVKQIHDAPDLDSPGPAASTDMGYDPDSAYIHGRSRVAADD